MNKQGKIRILLIWVLLIGIVLAVTGCSSAGAESSQSKDAASNSQPQDVFDNPVFDLYKQIKINDKKADIEKKLGATGNT